MPNWLQANIRLRRRHGDPVASAAALFGELRVAVKAWRASGAVQRCYFVRKPPDVRLRLEFSSVEAEIEIVRWLDARRGRSITSWTRACYEPEAALLGGAHLLDHVHAYFDVDTTAFMDFWRPFGDASLGPCADERAGLSALALSLSVLNDLFVRAVDGREEVWDVWWNLASLHGGATPSHEPSATPVKIDDLLGRVPAYDERILKRYRRANTSLANAMRRLGARGKLLFGRRSVLPFVALFHWNRYGFALEERARVFSAMMSAWDPGRQFHGRFEASGAT
ncbi:MAG TPA: thiopeptide-type bacteriocin biosynthesis protein [Polyangiaceae bacterium]|nr:thiopeptide-type bacteriocin biosynthesis protein [Polyangiaceae bacterium]